MQTEAELCNLALTYAQHGQLLDSLEEKSPAARLCKVVYPTARDLLLRRHAWPFATKSATLALLDGVARPGWAFAYAVPTDLLASQYLFTGVRPGAPLYPSDALACPDAALYPRAARPIPFALEASDDGAKQILLTDQEDAQLVYTAQVKTVGAFPPDFAEALAYEVASRLARGLVKNAKLAQSLRQESEVWVARAWVDALNTQQADPQPESSFITGRW